MFSVPYLIPDLEQIVFDYAIDYDFVGENNKIITKKDTWRSVK